MKTLKFNKKVPVLFCLLAVWLNSTGQHDCILEIGDYCTQTSKTITFRSSPEISNKNVVRIINDDSDKIGFYLVDNKTYNGFIHVSIWDFMKSDDENIEVSDDAKIGWVAVNLVEFIQIQHIYMEGSNSTVYDNDIEVFEDLKLSNRCTYSKSRHASLFYGRGKERLRESNYKGAKSDFSKAIELWGTSEVGFSLGATTFRAFAKYSDRDYYGSISDFNIVIGNYAKIPSYLFNHAGTSMKLIDFLFYRGTCYFMIESYQKALIELNRVLSMDHQYGPAYFIRGQVKDNLKDKEGCCKDLSKAFDLGVEQAYNEITRRCK